VIPQVNPLKFALNDPIPYDPLVDVAIPYDVSVPYSKPRVEAFSPPVESMEPFMVADVFALLEAGWAETDGTITEPFETVTDIVLVA
jgi:hypothetical protein